MEADETYFGNLPEENGKKVKSTGRPLSKKASGYGAKRAVVALVERGGKVRSFHPAQADGPSVAAIVRENIAKETVLHTDESQLYFAVGKNFAGHETVTHSAKEYAHGDLHTNTIEGYFSIFKRGMRGVYQHCGEKHLHRYLAEYDFRYNTRTSLGYNDLMRAEELAANITSKRLTYRRPVQA